MNYNKRKNAFKSKNRSKRKTSNIRPESLIKKAIPKIEYEYISENDFSIFNLNESLMKNISKKGYRFPTEIQNKAIEQLKNGANLIGIAATGTGKTGAFLIPIIHRILNNDMQHAIVIVPTRELAMQVNDEFKSLTLNTRLKSACFIGGTPLNKDIYLAKKMPHLVVGTPGRLIDLINRNALKVNKIETLVLDEFDRMLDMGFINDINFLVDAMYERKQTMLFSATIDTSQKRLIEDLVENPVKVNITTGTNSSDNVTQDIIRVGHDESKIEVLINLINKDSFEKVMLFAETKRTVDKVSRLLKKSGIKNDVIHGDKSQNYRSKAIKLFKSGKIQVLVETDVAARGIDIDNITHVINYQMPQTMDSYIHRIGRTGRAGKTGMAYTFVN